MLYFERIKEFGFFSFDCQQKNHETFFFAQCQVRRRFKQRRVNHTRSVKVQNQVDLVQRGPTAGPRMEFVRPAEQFCTSLVDYKQRQPFSLENAMILGRK